MTRPSQTGGRAAARGLGSLGSRTVEPISRPDPNAQSCPAELRDRCLAPRRWVQIESLQNASGHPAYNWLAAELKARFNRIAFEEHNSERVASLAQARNAWDQQHNTGSAAKGVA